MNRAILAVAAVLLAAPAAAQQNFLFDPNNPTDTLGQRQQQNESQRSLQQWNENRARDNLDHSTQQRLQSQRRTNELLQGDRGTRPVDTNMLRTEQQRTLDDAQKEREARERLDKLQASPSRLPGH